MENCVFCGSGLKSKSSIESGTHNRFYNCPFCGPFKLEATVSHWAEAPEAPHQRLKKFFPYAINCMRTDDNPVPCISREICESILANPPIPNPKEIANNILLHLGKTQETPGVGVSLEFKDIGSIVGCSEQVDLTFILEAMVEQNLIQWHHQTPTGKLTFKGWEEFEKLHKGQNSNDIVFMAMQFGDAELDKLIDEHVRPAINRTGLALRKLNDSESLTAGLIDDRLRQQIKTSKLVLADLTHGNKGAYWEAGYAEGIGKPVIYLCKEAAFKDPEVGSHFDTNHHLHILWDIENIDECMDKLVACIRATIPTSKQVD